MEKRYAMHTVTKSSNADIRQNIRQNFTIGKKWHFIIFHASYIRYILYILYIRYRYRLDI